MANHAERFSSRFSFCKNLKITKYGGFKKYSIKALCNKPLFTKLIEMGTEKWTAVI